MTRKTRLAIVVSHPIQHFVHLYRRLAREPGIELKVFFCSRIGLQSYFDKEMNTTIAWHMDLLSGYDHEFLPEADAITGTGWRSLNNPSIPSRLSAFRPDAVMVYGYSSISALRVIGWCIRPRIPILMAGDGDNTSERTRLKAIARRTALGLLLPRIAAFLTVGDQNEAMLAGLGVPREKMFRTPFPIDENAYHSLGARRDKVRGEIRNTHGIADDAVVLLSVGKMSPRKRPLDIVEALAELKSSAPATYAKLHILFCGDGSEMETVKRRLSETGVSATLAGFINVDALPKYFLAADILVHPSERDPHPLVGSEAAACGLPMILSDRVGLIGPTDIGRRDYNALIYPCGNIDALARSISTLVPDGARRKEMSAASRNVFEQCNMAASVSGMRRALGAVAS